MAMQINLLGSPSIRIDGDSAAGPRGSKAWAVLAYLLLTDRPVPRTRLIDLLFDEAEDPAAALRWTLSQLRRALGAAGELSGDPIQWISAKGTCVDTGVLLRGTWSDALSLPSFGGGLLEGLSLRTGPAFELWLSGERRRLAATTASVLHEAAHSRLAQGDARAAVELATRLVASDPLDENGHELLVRSLMASGNRSEAVAQVQRCEQTFRRELHRDPPPSLRAALTYRPPAAVRPNRAAVLAAIDVGLGAAQAGAYDRAVEVLRQAAAAGGEEKTELSARALYALGTVLVHGVRGSDEEALWMLHRAFLAASESGAQEVAAQAAYELGLVETLRGHYPRMETWFAKAETLAAGDPRLLAWTNVYAGIGRTDQADYPRAMTSLELSLDLARSSGDRRALAYAAAGIGRFRLLRGELGLARRALEESCATTRELGWTSFLAFPQSLLAEVDLLEGRLEATEEGFEHSYAIACQVRDPCWESYALRGRGLLAAARGDAAAALELLTEAPEASRRLPDTHSWVEAYCLEALCDFGVRRGLADAPGWIEELDDFASRRGMRELVARAALHRKSLGQPGADEGAAILVATIDNPALGRVAAAASAG